MEIEIIKFETIDNLILNGHLKTCGNKTDKVLIQIHGMTSNCFKNRESVIANKVAKLNIDTICFNNRGSEIMQYCKKTNGEQILQGTAYENIEDSYYDILGAICYAVDLGYKEIYIQGHSLGATKIVYTYNKMLEEKNQYLKYIKAVILLSLIDIPDMLNTFAPKEIIELANKKENEPNKILPIEEYFHPLSVKTFLKYTKYYETIDFAKYSDINYNFEKLNNINIPLFMRWGDNKELIKQDAKQIVKLLNSKIHNNNKDIDYIEGANHSYSGKEKELSEEINKFLEGRTL